MTAKITASADGTKVTIGGTQQAWKITEVQA